MVCFTIPPGSAPILRKIKGLEHFDEAIHVPRGPKPGTGTKDAPRVFSVKLRKTSRAIGLLPFAYDQEFEKMDGLLVAKHVDDINMAGEEKNIEYYQKKVDAVFG